MLNKHELERGEIGCGDQISGEVTSVHYNNDMAIDWSIGAGPIWLIGLCVCMLGTLAWAYWRESR